MATNDSNQCTHELDLGFNLLYITAPMNLVIMCINILVIAAVSRTPSLHTNTNILLASISVADLILGVAYLCYGVVGRYTINLADREQRVITSFVFGQWFSGILITVIHNGIIAIDRYIFITRPFYYMKHVTKKCAFIALFSAWIFCLIFMFLPMLLYTDDKYHGNCILLHIPTELYFLGGVVYLLGCSTVLVCYFRVASLAFKRKRAANARNLPNADNNDTDLRKNCSAALRSVKFFVLMFGVFFSCTFPPVIISGISTFRYSVPNYVQIPVMLLISANSIFSFIIYFCLNKNFSQAVRKAFSDLKVRICQQNRLQQ